MFWFFKFNFVLIKMMWMGGGELQLHSTLLTLQITSR